MSYKTQAEVLIAAGQSMQMQAEAGIVTPICKFPVVNRLGKLSPICGLKFDGYPSHYEFPRGVVEGTQVFDGDVIYDDAGHPFTVPDVNGRQMNFGPGHLWTLQPPAPQTVTVELLREDAEYIITNARLVSGAGKRLYVAIRKALQQ